MILWIYRFMSIYQRMMEQNIGYIVLGVLVGCILWYFIAKIWFLLDMRKHRSHAVKQSRSVVMWQVSEQIAPLLPDFPYHYKDVMFLWKWVDYIVFDGLHTGYLDKVVLLEVKSGNSQLNRNEKLIRDCIRRGDVEYDVWRI